MTEESPKAHGGQLFAGLPDASAAEQVTALAGGQNARVERIVSRGQVTPPGVWYDQDEAEWVIVLQGKALLEIEGEPIRHLEVGSWVDIPAHVRHRVVWTAPDMDTIWLAVFYAH